MQRETEEPSLLTRSELEIELSSTIAERDENKEDINRSITGFSDDPTETIRLTTT